MRNNLAIIVVIIGIGLSLYVGIWLMLIEPIVSCCIAFDTGTLTGIMIGVSVIKCIFSNPVGLIILHTAIKIAAIIAE